ncbi:diguanylate cyclase domain-containing protein [Psychromonas sp.]|uniref:sensor domain-containing diguanylate cyclase n=1 Tax=Psychromonas sp. TaxID=1884585 RepID=UPI0035619924
MKSSYRIVAMVTFLLVTLSLIISVVNYQVSLKSAQEQLRERSLPLTVDNIYTEIQKHIIEPNLIASMMAQDTFLRDWLIFNEDDVDKISTYLDTIKNRYKMFVTFLVSEKTRNYYTRKGLLEQVVEGNPNNDWYFNFMETTAVHEINLDFNEYIDDGMIMFINHKIYDENYHTIGITGIGLKISYVNDMLKHFRQQYLFNVYFLNKEGEVVLYEHGVNSLKNIADVQELNSLRDVILSKNSRVIDYIREGEEYLINTKYIPELDLYLVVEAKLSGFTQEVRKTFYFNLLISLFATLIITFLILKTIKNHHLNLNHLAQYDDLTKLKNRRVFNEELEHSLLLSRRRHSYLSLLFFDLDDFKIINDTLGHQTGDKVLVRLADIIRDNLRQTDLKGRWGGEEFIVALIDTDLDTAKIIAEKLKKAFEEDKVLSQLTDKKVTASFGLTMLNSMDTIDSLLSRADNALYEAKKGGKNMVVSVL